MVKGERVGRWARMRVCLLELHGGIIFVPTNRKSLKGECWPGMFV